jgi:uncharacterized protein (TIGR00255 family)
VIKSMTGFASLTVDGEDAAIGVTIKAVNHRFLDAQIRLPAALARLEASLRSEVQARVSRGRIEVVVSVQRRSDEAPVVEINEPFVVALRQALDEAGSKGLVAGPLTPGDLLRWPHAITVREKADNVDPVVETRLDQAVTAAVVRAVTALDEMRTEEGAHLAADFDTRVARLGLAIEEVAASAEGGREATVARLHERIADLGLDGQADATTMAQEVVRAAGRSDIAEELTRFRAHLEHWRLLVEGDEPCGRKLDFLLQEMNREINTIGAKAGGEQLPNLVIDVKAELERIREQVQNVE